MRLVLIRHAKAKERDPRRWPDDTRRPLTRGGERAFRKLAAALPVWIDPPACVLASGWVRAWDTAAALSKETGWPAPERCPSLETEGGPDAVTALRGTIQKLEHHTSLALVGHEPVLGELVQSLLGCSGAVPLAKGAVALLEVDANGAELLALVPPKAMG
jgi:phosphohistidine phosphatase SixA